VSPGYFSAMGIPLVKGRHFEWSDTADQTRVLMINEAFARKYFPNEDPLGRRLAIGGGFWRPIIGIVGDVRHVSLGDPAKPELYVPISQEPVSRLDLVVRARTDSLALMDTVRAVIRSMEKDAPVTVRTMDEVVDESIVRPRLFLSLTGFFAGLALLLAALGLYGVISYSVAQRTQEVGIRMALGAQPSEVLRMVVAQSLVLVSIGIGVGIPMALGLTRYLESFLFGVESGDALTFVVVCVTLLASGVAAAWAPAWRAAKVDPVIALRTE
jgi:putative ABC transport system permease protein